MSNCTISPPSLAQHISYSARQLSTQDDVVGGGRPQHAVTPEIWSTSTSTHARNHHRGDNNFEPLEPKPARAIRANGRHSVAPHPFQCRTAAPLRSDAHSNIMMRYVAPSIRMAFVTCVRKSPGPGDPSSSLSTLFHLFMCLSCTLHVEYIYIVWHISDGVFGGLVSYSVALCAFVCAVARVGGQTAYAANFHGCDALTHTHTQRKPPVRPGAVKRQGVRLPNTNTNENTMVV